jgi:hypothetical protein
MTSILFPIFTLLMAYWLWRWYQFWELFYRWRNTIGMSLAIKEVQKQHDSCWSLSVFWLVTSTPQNHHTGLPWGHSIMYVNKRMYYPYWNPTFAVAQSRMWCESRMCVFCVSVGVG